MPLGMLTALSLKRPMQVVARLPSCPTTGYAHLWSSIDAKCKALGGTTYSNS